MPEVPSSPEVSWMDRPKSVELIKYTHDTIEPAREKKMKEIDTLLENHLGAKEYVDAYGNQKIKALHAMKMYIDRAYMICEAEAHKSEMTSAGRQLWNERFFKNCEEDVNNYIAMITAFLIEAAKKNTKGANAGKIDLDTLFDLAERGREFYMEIANNPEYGKLLKKINTVPHKPLEKEENEFIVNKFPLRIPGEMSADDSMKLLEASGAMTILYAMDADQRMEFASYIIENRDPAQAIGLITSLGSSGYITNAQLEGIGGSKGLYAAMEDKKIITDKQKKDMEMTIKIGQAKAEMIRKNIDVSIHADMDKNLAIKFFEPRYIGGLALMTWRGANMALSIIAYRNDLSEYLKSPWLIADVAGILAGSALVGNPTVLEAIKEKGDAKTLEEQACKLAVWQLITSNPGVTDKYFTGPMKGKDATKETGMIELLTVIREEKEKKSESMNVKMDEILRVAEGNDPNTKTRMATKPVSKELVALLKGANEQEKKSLEQYASVVCSSKILRTTVTFQQWIDHLKKIQGIKG